VAGFYIGRLILVESSDAFVDDVGEELEIWPLWVCPALKKMTFGSDLCRRRTLQ